MKRQTLFYLATILIFGAAMWFVLAQGRGLEFDRVDSAGVERSVSAAAEPGQAGLFSNLVINAHHPLAVLIMQILIIMIVARIFGYVMTRIGQPSVVGEIVAGIALGPSLLGFVLPEFSLFLFPEDSLRRLHVLSQIGLVLFMFIIGMELDLGVLQKKAKEAVIVSHASIVFPYFLGVALAYVLYPQFAPPSVSFSAFALFMGIAMSITAFPVLARIVQERNLTQTPLGTLVITCAAADDITAWCLLALVVAIVSAGGLLSAVGSIVLSVLYVLFMWFVVRPVLHRVAVKYDTPESINKTVVAAIFGILLVSSYLTEIIGIHALFGAFIAGVIMPAQKEFKLILSEKIEDVSLVLLLPLFFVFTGLRTQVGLLNQAHLWGACLLIIAVAVLGKFLGSAVAAKFVGIKWKDSLLIGALMNSRGLMELVVLNIGYDLGVLSTEIFTMMVLMALATTFMTGPAINVIEFFFKPKQAASQQPAAEGLRPLISFGAPRSGGRLLEVAYYLNLKNEKDSLITAAHFSPSTDISIAEAQEYEREAFLPLQAAAQRLGITTRTIFRVTDDVQDEIIETVKEFGHNFVLVGGSRLLFGQNRTGGIIKALVHDLKPALGIFIDKGFVKVSHIAIELGGRDDLFLLNYARRALAGSAKVWVTVIAPRELCASEKDAAALMGMAPSEQIGFVDRSTLAQRTSFDLVLISLALWEKLQDEMPGRLSALPSLLIINK